MPTLKSLQKEIDALRVRNARVEADKAWETSFTRRFLILVLTYTVIVVFFFASRLPDPFANAVVPTAAFLLSQMTVPVFKNWWLKRRRKGIKT